MTILEEKVIWAALIYNILGRLEYNFYLVDMILE